MPTPTELKIEIESGPLAVELADAWSGGRTNEVADALNRRDRAGYVPARWVISCLKSDLTGVGAGLIWAWVHGEMLDGSPVPPTVKALLARLFFAAESSGYDFRFPPGELSAGCDALAAPNALKAALLSGEVQISRAEELWGYGYGVSLEDVSEARRVE